MQKEMGILRNRLTAVEGRKENRNEYCSQAVSLPPLPGLSGQPSFPPPYQPVLPSLVPLPPLPGMPSLPTMPELVRPMSYHPFQDIGSTSMTWSQSSCTSRKVRSPEHRGWESPPSLDRLSQWEDGRWYSEQKGQVTRTPWLGKSTLSRQIKPVGRWSVVF